MSPDGLVLSFRGKCSVTLLNETESLKSYLEREVRLALAGLCVARSPEEGLSPPSWASLPHAEDPLGLSALWSDLSRRDKDKHLCWPPRLPSMLSCGRVAYGDPAHCLEPSLLTQSRVALCEGFLSL